jgi:ubiquinone/menaquinone biosynthesis C-methylase UbiE
MACSSPNYGIDAPAVLRRFFLLGLAGVLVGLGCLLAVKNGFAPWLRFLLFPFLCMGAWFMLTAAVMLWGSKKGKLRLRDKILSAIPWRGDELVLDVGCGHGLLLVGAAKRLRDGKAIGVDLWQEEDQAGNSRQATWANVQIENVANRVELKEGDARNLPFANNTFDVVLSSWALHNIYDQAGRETAVNEIVRTLKPGGRLVILDIKHTREYAQTLEQNRMLNVQRDGPKLLFVIPTFVLSATKPTFERSPVVQ